MKKLPDIKKDFAGWYQEVITQAELADSSPVRGTIIIRPYAYAIWEIIRNRLDERIKATGHQNAAFPLLIPESYLKKEATHVEGFAPEVAVVTHAGGKKLEEPLIVRPTSETIIHEAFSRWIQSWRDLPLKINQWANVVRWEMRPRAFLRTTEFFWQEGHTAHATWQEAQDEVLMILNEYIDLAHGWLAIPAIPGLKPEMEKFPGAEQTYTFEGLMQDGKAVQMGTSHLLAQGFAESFDIAFQDQDGERKRPYLTSWGTTTRLLGTVIMVHGDNKGLVLPPLIAPIQVVIIPILKTGADNSAVTEVVDVVERILRAKRVRVHIDQDTNKTPGAKFYHWEIRGVPLRIEIGPRDIAHRQVVVSDRLGMAKESIMIDALEQIIPDKLGFIQSEMLKRATAHRDAMWHQGAKREQFGDQLTHEGGFYQTGWCGEAACEQTLRQHQATIRVVLSEHTYDQCFECTKASLHDILVAKAY